jgi:hypothetical protein
MPLPAQQCWSIIVAALERWTDRTVASVLRLARGRLNPGGSRRLAQHTATRSSKVPEFAGQAPYDVGSLFRRMAMLRIDRNELARDDPLLFRELQGICTLCRNKERCGRDLAHQFTDPWWFDWRDYCPNAATLGLLRTFQGIVDAHK